MKKSSFIYLMFLVTAVVLNSCDSKIEDFDFSEGFSGTPSSVTSVSSEARPGEIMLKWDVPVDSNYTYLQISYYDFLTEQQVYKIASVYTDSMLIENTRAKFGDYSFTFETFNSKGEGGEKQTFSAVSGPATITETFTVTEIQLIADQLSTNSQEPSEGPIANLVDNNVSTFFHTIWSTTKVAFPIYIQVDLDDAVENFQFYYQNREWSQVGPGDIEVQISNDGAEWETIAEITSGLPSGGSAEYTSDVFRPDHTFTYFRLNVVSAIGGASYFNLAEFKLYNVDISIDNPEE